MEEIGSNVPSTPYQKQVNEMSDETTGASPRLLGDDVPGIPSLGITTGFAIRSRLPDLCP